MNYKEAVEYIHALGELGWKPGLARFSALCERLGNPHERLRVVHVGGTNGKGSTTVMTASILRAAGYRVGAYYSPYVYDLRERVQIDGMIPEEDFTRLVERIRPHAAAIGETPLGHPTEFEVKTALGLCYFAEEKVDFAVLEVGLGGRLDATNIVDPAVSVITNVSLDHTDRLGETITDIAGEKAGIVKENRPLITAVEHPEALAVLTRVCAERNAPILRVRRHGNCFTIGDAQARPAPGFTVIGKREYPDLALRMRGDFQHANAACAVGAVEAVADVPESAVRAGLAEARLPGRLEVLRERPTLLVDGAHNADGAKSLAEALAGLSYRKLILVIGMVGGHSPDDVVGRLAPLADRVIATQPQNERAAPASKIAAVAVRHCPDVAEVGTVREAVARALDHAGEDDLICVTGSFYVVGEVPRAI
ncbi:MAG: bifunctional folylpolyglutamate synthase/dihydrofolate synthase [Armatimonadota bacterium]